LRPGSSAASPADLAGALEDRFVTAVARRARPGEKLGLSLSGGLDARTILGVMPAGVDLQAVSLGIEGSLDHRSAAELARLAGVPHHAYVLGAGFLESFEEHLRQMVRLTDGARAEFDVEFTGFSGKLSRRADGVAAVEEEEASPFTGPKWPIDDDPLGGSGGGR